MERHDLQKIMCVKKQDSSDYPVLLVSENPFGAAGVTGDDTVTRALNLGHPAGAEFF
jgi:hypothetical protein